MKKALCLILCFVMIAGLIPARANAQELKFDRYGYKKLENDQQRYVYKTLVLGIASRSEKVKIEQQVTGEDLGQAIQMIVRDYPEYFWFNEGSISRYSFDGLITEIPLTYTMSNSEISVASAAFDSKVNTIINAMPAAKTSDYEKALYLHDALAAAVEYQSSDNDQTAYGALVEGKAVCAGYARAYQCLLLKAGIQSWYVTGQSYNPQGQLESHAWNLVFIHDALSGADQCLYTDVTWDDQTSLFHMFFNCGGKEFMTTHFPDEFSSPKLPNCSHTGNDYFVQNHRAQSGVYYNLTDATTAAQAANNFTPMSVKNGVGTRRLDILYSGTDFEHWINSNLSELVQKLGFTGYSCSYFSLGAEYQLIISGTPANPAVEATGIELDKTSIPLTVKGQTETLHATVIPNNATDQTVTFASQNPEIASVDPKTGLITAISNGETKITATTSNGIKVSCKVQVNIPPEASIKVTGGSAYLEDGSVAERAGAGQTITIRAEEAPEGMEFHFWSITIGNGVVLADPSKPETTFKMPAQGAVQLRANYRAKTVHVTGVTLDVTQITLPAVGAAAKLKASLQPANATNQKLVWTSQNPQVVTVKDGTLKAVAPGTAEVTVTTEDGGFVARCTVTVAQHTHDKTLQAVTETKPTCTENGYQAHFVCASCGMWFEDEQGQHLLADHSKILLKATGHTPSAWHSDGKYHWQTCTAEGCGAQIAASRQPHSDSGADGKCDTCGAQMGLAEATSPTESTNPSEPPDPTTPSGSAPETEPTKPADQPKSSGGGWIIWLVVSLAVAAGAVAGWFFLKKRK